MSTVSLPTKCEWLKKTNQQWKFDFGLYVGLFGYFASLLAVFVLFPIGFFWRPAWYIIAALIAMYFTLYGIEHWVVRCLIKCAACGHNPTRRKKDGRPLGLKRVYGRLLELQSCPDCGQ